MNGPEYRNFIHADLHKSARNVRTNEEDSEATDALEASIARFGLRHPLEVHPAGDGAPTPWGVYAGGRRLRAIGRLIEAGRLPADWPIRCTIDDLPAAEITEMSLAENLLRRDLRPYEVHAAIAEAFDQGDSPAEIAAKLGQTPQWVAKQLRLGKLARPIFDAYAAGKLSFDQASAYAATEDTVLQISVFAAYASLPINTHTAARIRAALKVGDRAAARLLLFVGEAIYVGAGGAVEPDLFADGGDIRVRITDEPLLRRLAEERFAAMRDRIRTDTKRADLRFAAQPPQYAGQTDSALEIVGGPTRLPAGDIVATIDVDDEGQPVTRFWWANRAAKGAADKGAAAAKGPAAQPAAPELVATAGEALTMPDSAYAQSGRTIAKDEYGLAADGLQLLRSLRRSLLRRLLIEEGGSVSRDYLIWAQARAMFAHQIAALTGCRAIIDEWQSDDRPPQALYDDCASDVVAERDWKVAVAALKAADYMIEKDPATSLQMFLDSDSAEKDFAAAIVAGEALLRSADTPGWRIAAHDVLARACGADAKGLRRWWTPTLRWVGLFGRMFRLGAAQQFVDAGTHEGFIKIKDAELAVATVTALDPLNHKDPDTRARAARWLPDLLAFGPDLGAPLIEAIDDAAPPDETARLKLKESFREKQKAPVE